MFILSLSTSFLHSICYNTLSLNLSSPFSSIETKYDKNRYNYVKSFRQKLIDVGAPVAQVVFLEYFIMGNHACIVSSLNVFELPLKNAALLLKIEEAYINLVDKLIEIGEFRMFSIDKKSFMFEVSTNKIVLVDVYNLLKSETLRDSKENYRTRMHDNLKLFFSNNKLKPEQDIEVMDDKELKTELFIFNHNHRHLEVNNVELNYLDTIFEETYASSNLDPRSKIRKMVEKLPDPPSDDFTSSILTIRGIIDKDKVNLLLASCKTFIASFNFKISASLF